MRIVSPSKKEYCHSRFASIPTSWSSLPSPPLPRQFLKTVGNLEATLKYEQGLYRGLCQVFLMQILQPSQMAKAMLESRWLITDVIM